MGTESWCYAGDKESYKVFSQLFNPIIETYHNKKILGKHKKIPI